MDDIRKVVFSVPLDTLTSITRRYKQKVPEPLSSQFPNRAGREEAIKRKEARKKSRTELFPPGS